jgi:zinc protease
MFLALAIANQGVEADVLREQLNREVERIISEGISDAELEKAKNAFRASYVFQSQTSMQVAERLQHYIHYHDSLDDMATDLELYMQVTAEDIQRVAAEYLKSENSYTIIIVPKAGSGEEVVP